MRTGTECDNIQIELSDGITFMTTPKFGGTGGSDREPWSVPEGEYITQVEQRSGERTDSLTFITNKNNRSPQFGGNGGTYHLTTFPEGYRIIGLYGKQGSKLDQLGFILAKTIYPSGEVKIIRKNLVSEE